jgi:hypothetical protein
VHVELSVEQNCVGGAIEACCRVHLFSLLSLPIINDAGFRGGRRTPPPMTNTFRLGAARRSALYAATSVLLVIQDLPKKTLGRSTTLVVLGLFPRPPLGCNDRGRFGLSSRGLTVGDPTAVESQWNTDRQVNARHRFAREILCRKNHQIRLTSIEIVCIGHDIAFVLASA